MAVDLTPFAVYWEAFTSKVERIKNLLSKVFVSTALLSRHVK